MNDAERLVDIVAVARTWINEISEVEECMSQIRKILREPDPNVEWTPTHRDGFRAGYLTTIDACAVYVFPYADHPTDWHCEILHGDLFVLEAEFSVPTTIDAQRRAVALYVALRGVT